MDDRITIKKIGARVLSEREVFSILPTYERLKEQIEEMRKRGTAKGTGGEISYTNNIGVLGARGSGKTSVLKTLTLNLQEDNRNGLKNILLPMIVPERMSECMNLMGAILGLFQNQVAEITKKQNDEARPCWERKKTAIQDYFDTLVKKFCYIQGEFRSVLVRQYTTDTEYARNSSKVFNSDSEFLPDFNKFIDSLLKHESFAEDAMIFLFIDDIDLSTHRCTDVVKTLLSYINHPRIITIISGDLDTFEEALTLDFLRQEHALNGELLDKCFMQKIKDSQLLERKKLLSYEYLKKILPPIYRHTIKKWNLADRGKYKIEVQPANDKNASNKNAMSDVQEESLYLSELLKKTFRQFGCATYFQFGNTDEERKELPSGKCIPQVFHLFDDTARGLNNVYYTLLNEQDNILAYGELLKKESESENSAAIARNAFNSICLFLETVVASNRVLSNYRTLLLQEIIQFGDSFESTVVRFDNLLHAVYDVQASSKEKGKISEKEIKGVSNPVERFTLFLFTDFAKRILSHSYKEAMWSEDYKNVRKMAVLDLLNYPVISGNTQTFESEITPESLKGKGVLELFSKAEFGFLLHYFQYVITFSKDEHKFLQDYLKDLKRLKEIQEKFYIPSYDAIVSLYKQIVSDPEKEDDFKEIDKIGEMFPDAIEILDKLSKIYVGELDLVLRKILDKQLQKNLEDQKNQGNPESIPYGQILLCNTLSEAVKTKLFNNQNQLKPFDSTLEFEMKQTDITSKQIRILKVIDQNNLWTNDDIKPVTNFLEKKMKAIVDELKPSADISLGDVKQALNPFMNNSFTYSTGLYYLSKNIRNKLGNQFSNPTLVTLYEILGNEGTEVIVKDCNENDNKMTINGYCANNRIYYRKSEVLNLRNKLKELKITELETLLNDENEYIYWFYFYALMRQASGELAGVYKQSTQAAKLSKILNDIEIATAAEDEKRFTNLLNTKEILENFPDDKE